MMNLLRSVVFLLVAALAVQSAEAVLLNFDEFPSPTTFAAGQAFQVTEAFSPTPAVVDFLSVPLTSLNGAETSHPALIGAPEDVGYSSRPLGSSGNVIYPRAVEADFTGSVGRRSSVSIQFFNSGGTVNLGVNGLTPLVANGVGSAPFLSFDGTTLGGVAVSVFDFGDGRGRIDLTGPIDRVLFGGQESLFDAIRTIAAPSPAGDYNSDGFVTAADYTIWRDAASPDGGTAAEYDTWAAGFGSQNAAAESTVVPEPASLSLLAGAFAGGLFCRYGRKRTA